MFRKILHRKGFHMIRDIDFNVPNAEVAAELIKLCEAEGWTVDPEKDVFHYVAGVPFVFGYEGEEPYVPEHTHSSVIAHKTSFVYDELTEIYSRADAIAAKVGGEVTGGGTSFSEGEGPKLDDLLEPIKDVIPFKDDAQPIVDYIISQVGEDLPGMRDQAMEIRKLLVETGWTPPVSAEDFAV